MKKLIILSILIFNTIVTAENLILDGKTIPLSNSSTVTIDPVTGDIIATSVSGSLTCSNIGFAPTLAMSINPPVVDSGGSTQIAWAIENDAVSCTKSGGWSGVISGADVTNGTHVQTINNITSNTTYTMVCTNNFGDSPTRSVSVSINGGNPECVNQPPILNGAEDFTIKLIPGAGTTGPGSPQDPNTYDGTYDDIAPGDNVDWPGVYGTQGFMTLTKNQYAAMQFNTDNSNEKAKFVFTTPGNGQGPPTNATTVSISECPGDFTTHLNQSRCLAVGGATPNIRWSLNPSENPATHCLLNKNTTYYLNIVHSNTTVNGYTTSACTGPSYCGIIFNQTSENN